MRLRYSLFCVSNCLITKLQSGWGWKAPLEIGKPCWEHSYLGSRPDRFWMLAGIKTPHLLTCTVKKCFRVSGKLPWFSLFPLPLFLCLGSTKKSLSSFLIQWDIYTYRQDFPELSFLKSEQCQLFHHFHTLVLQALPGSSWTFAGISPVRLYPFVVGNLELGSAPRLRVSP